MDFAYKKIVLSKKNDKSKHVHKEYKTSIFRMQIIDYKFRIIALQNWN